MKTKSTRRTVRRLGLALAAVALMVPATAQAMTMNASYESGGGIRLYADDVHAMVVPVEPQRLYADDLHSSLATADDLHASLAPAAARIQRQYVDDRQEVLVQRPRQYADDLHASLPVSEPRTFEPINTQARPDLVPQPVNEVVPVDSTSFDWSDAGIGAAGAFGLMLLGIGILLVARSTHSHKGRLAAT